MSEREEFRAFTTQSILLTLTIPIPLLARESVRVEEWGLEGRRFWWPSLVASACLCWSRNSDSAYEFKIGLKIEIKIESTYAWSCLEPTANF